MANDTTITSVFEHAKQGPLSGGEFPTLPAVFATLVEHSPNSHPAGTENADLVSYAHGKLVLSSDKKTLSGEFKVWRNKFVHGSPGFFGTPAKPDDAFADANNKLTVAITLSEGGTATIQRKIDGKPIGGMPPQALKAPFTNAMFVEPGVTGVKSLSFTLGSTA